MKTPHRSSVVPGTVFGLVLLSAWLAPASLAKTFFGAWEPPASGSEFWKPMDESWWNPSDTARIRTHCKKFAAKTNPAALIDDIVRDTKENFSLVRMYVYSLLILQWQSDETLPRLKLLSKSKDADTRRIATEFIADIEEVSERK